MLDHRPASVSVEAGTAILVKEWRCPLRIGISSIPHRMYARYHINKSDLACPCAHTSVAIDGLTLPTRRNPVFRSHTVRRNGTNCPTSHNEKNWL